MTDKYTLADGVPLEINPARTFAVELSEETYKRLLCSAQGCDLDSFIADLVDRADENPAPAIARTGYPYYDREKYRRLKPDRSAPPSS